MAADRYVVLGLAPARAEWFRAVAHWCNAASLPAEFVKCVSVEQVRAHLAGRRRFSALLVDGGVVGLDRDLVNAAGRHGVAVLAVDDGRARDWSALGVAVVLPARFGPDHLLDALGAHATRVGSAEVIDLDDKPAAMASGRVVAVCGPGGTGASTVAIALAQSSPRPALLADLSLRAEQAMLHDARDVTPGVQELVESFRSGRTDAAGFTFRVAERGYDLLLGLRQAKHWPALRPRAFEAAFDALRCSWATVVCDTDAEVEGEKECGSVDVEDRHVMARTALSRADVVFVVGLPGMKGTHSLVRTVNQVAAFGVGARRVVPVVNKAPRSPRVRAEIAEALSGLVGTPLAAPVFVPERRLDELLRDGARLPPVVTAPLASACAALLDEVGSRRVVAAEPELITPGSLGSWRDE